MADMEEVIGKEWKMVEIETRRRSKRQRKDLRGAVGGWENIGLRTGRDGSNRYEEDTIGTVEFEGCQKKKQCQVSFKFSSSRHHFAYVQLSAQTNSSSGRGQMKTTKKCFNLF